MIVSFLGYSAFRIGYDLFTFGDCPEAYDELMEDIKEAKMELEKLGITVNI